MNMGATMFTVAVLLSCFMLFHQTTANENTDAVKTTKKRNVQDESLAMLDMPIYSLGQRLRSEKAEWIKKQMADNKKLFAEASMTEYDPSLLEALSAEKRAFGGNSLNLPMMTLKARLAKQLQNQKAANDDLFRALGKR